MRKPWLFLPFLLLLLMACSLAQPIQPAQPTQPAPVIGEPQIPESEIPRVPLQEARNAFDSGAAVFVDVRAASSYESAHIPGALSIPTDEIETRLNELDPAQWIITYCT